MDILLYLPIALSISTLHCFIHNSDNSSMIENTFNLAMGLHRNRHHRSAYQEQNMKCPKRTHVVCHLYQK